MCFLNAGVPDQLGLFRESLKEGLEQIHPDEGQTFAPHLRIAFMLNARSKEIFRESQDAITRDCTGPSWQFRISEVEVWGSTQPGTFPRPIRTVAV